MEKSVLFAFIGNIIKKFCKQVFDEVKNRMSISIFAF
jgi:hypothetical protein